MLVFFFSKMCFNVEEHPIHNATTCPKNQSEFNERSAAINCTHTDEYLCLPNEMFSEFFEFCFPLTPIGIKKGKLKLLKF